MKCTLQGLGVGSIDNLSEDSITKFIEKNIPSGELPFSGQLIIDVGDGCAINVNFSVSKLGRVTITGFTCTLNGCSCPKKVSLKDAIALIIDATKLINSHKSEIRSKKSTLRKPRFDSGGV